MTHISVSGKQYKWSKLDCGKTVNVNHGKTWSIGQLYNILYRPALHKKIECSGDKLHQQSKTRNRPQQHKNKDGNETKVNALIEQ